MDDYFADPHSPGQRGTNENTNGLLRQYLPNGTKSPNDAAYLDAIAFEMNNRPRKALGFRTPREVFLEDLAAARRLPLGSSTTTLDAATAHSAAVPGSADCNQRDG
jgi:hypothetical protein